MFKRSFAMVLAGILSLTAFGLKPTLAQDGNDVERVGRARGVVSRVGVGEKARVEVRMLDKTKIKGYVSNTGADSFTVTDRKTGATRTVAFAEVEKVSKGGGGLSTRSWVLISSAAAAAVVLGVLAKPLLCDGGAQTRGIC